MTRKLAHVVRGGFGRAGGRPLRVLVVGDLMLDRYLWGDVDRISPEAPVPVVRVTRKTERLGGSANVAANLAGLGLDVALAGHYGSDAEGMCLSAMLADAGIRAVLPCSDALPTITKTRILGGHQQMLRLDQEEIGPHPEASGEMLLSSVLSELDAWQPGALILSDYAKGTVTPDICRSLIASARNRGILVLVDPKGRDYAKYRGATALTPNQKEAAESCGCGLHDLDSILGGAEALRRELELDFLPVTRGEHGITLLQSSGVAHLPATARQVFDVSGAGDTVIAALTAGLLAGLDPEESCRLANIAAGVVVGKVGTVPVSIDELLGEIEERHVARQFS